MDRILTRIARWLSRQPWNRPGADKTWVLQSGEDHRRWLDAVRNAQRAGRR